jgi:uncharacterized delta-60 repeat protein
LTVFPVTIVCFNVITVPPKLCFGLLASIALAISAARPAIEYQPQSQSVILYQQAAFGVIARGIAPLQYQWQKNGVRIAGATNDQLVLRHSQFSDEGVYSVQVSNAEGTLLSTPATLRVNLPRAGDLDHSFAAGPSIDGHVRSIVAQPDGKILIAGEFAFVHGTPRRGIARLNVNGTTDCVFMNGLSGAENYFSTKGSIHSVALQSDGKIVVAGTFSAMNGVARTNIARLNADGTLDVGFNAEILQDNGYGGYLSGYPVCVAAQPDGKVLLIGSFSLVNGVRRSNIARLNSDGTSDTGFECSVLRDPPPCWLYGVAVQNDGKVLVGGDFNRVNGVHQFGIARINANGSLDTSFESGRDGGSSWTVSKIAVQSDRKIVIGSNFPWAGGWGIMRLNANGAVDGSFRQISDTIGSLSSLAVQADGRIFVAGSFRDANGLTPAGIMRLNPDGSLDNGFHAAAIGNLVTPQNDGRVLVGGWPGGPTGGIARLNQDGTLDNGFQKAFSGIVNSLNTIAMQADGGVLLGGTDYYINGVRHDGLARLAGDGGLDYNFQAAVDGYSGGTVYQVAAQIDNKIMVSGHLWSINDTARSSVARLNTDGSVDSSFQNGGLSSESVIPTLAMQTDGKVLIGGRLFFTNDNETALSYLARLNTDGTRDGGFLPGFSGPDGLVASAVLQSDGKVLIAGTFTNVNGVGQRRVARLNPDGSLDRSFRSVFGDSDRTAYPIALQSDGKVVVANEWKFGYIGGLRIRRLNSDGTLDAGFHEAKIAGAGGFARVHSIVVQRDGSILVAGSFSSIDGMTRTAIARLNADGSLNTDFETLIGGHRSTTFWINSALAQDDAKVLVGGYFGFVNGIPTGSIARLWGTDFPAVLKSLTRTANEVNVTWRAVSNRTYRVQYADDLAANDWRDVPGDVVATGDIASKTDVTTAGVKQRFYRVLMRQ